MKFRTLRIFGLVMGLMSAGAAADTGSSVDPIVLMQQVQTQASSSDEVVKIAMQLVEANGKTSNRQATFYRKQREPNVLADMKLIRFSSPAELNGSAVLIYENKGRADDQWLYLPAYRTSRKVPSSNRSDRYMGTDFFYEDVSNDKIEQNKYVVSGQEKIAGRNYIIVEQTPQNEELKKESAYGRKLQWVDPERFIVAKIDYFDKTGRLFKRMEATGAVQVSGRWRWSEMTMSDLTDNHKTLIQYRDRKIDGGLDEGVFSVRSLERPR